jgi:hypothetical protein
MTDTITLQEKNFKYDALLMIEQLTADCERLSLENTYYKFLLKNKASSPKEICIDLSKHPLAHKLFPMFLKDFHVKINNNFTSDVDTRPSNSKFIGTKGIAVIFVGTLDKKTYIHHTKSIFSKL